jgi:hypothetical protein
MKRRTLACNSPAQKNRRPRTFLSCKVTFSHKGNTGHKMFSSPFQLLASSDKFEIFTLDLILILVH